MSENTDKVLEWMHVAADDIRDQNLDALGRHETMNSKPIAEIIARHAPAFPGGVREAQPEGGYKDIINHVIGQLEPMARQIIHPRDNVFERMIIALRAARDYPTQSLLTAPKTLPEGGAEQLLDRVNHQLAQGRRIYPNSFLAEDIANYFKSALPSPTKETK